MVTTVAAAAVVARNARLSIVTSLVLPNFSNVGMIVRMLATLARTGFSERALPAGCIPALNAGVTVLAGRDTIKVRSSTDDGIRFGISGDALPAPQLPQAGEKFFAAVTLLSPWCVTQIPTLEISSQRRLLQSRSTGRASGARIAAMRPRAPSMRWRPARGL
jgi:hypothetical protein